MGARLRRHRPIAKADKVERFDPCLHCHQCERNDDIAAWCHEHSTTPNAARARCKARGGPKDYQGSQHPVMLWGPDLEPKALLRVPLIAADFGTCIGCRHVASARSDINRMVWCSKHMRFNTPVGFCPSFSAIDEKR